MPVIKAALRVQAISCGLAALLAAAPVSADPFSAAKSKATLTVTYTLTGGGTDRPESHEREVIWSVEDRYEIKAVMSAEAPMPYGGLHKADAAETANIQQRQAAAAAGAQNMQGMMEMAQAIMAKCGDDQACIQQETMKMSQQIDPNAPELQEAKKNIATASQSTGNRYQLFSPHQQTGTYKIAEKAHEAYFDAACSLRNQSPCAFDSTVTGAGALTDEAGQTSMQTNASAEIDTKDGNIILSLPIPGIAAAQKAVTSKSREVKTGTFDAPRRLSGSKLYDERISVSCGACRAASGTLTREVKDEFLGRPAKLVIDWKFARQ